MMTSPRNFPAGRAVLDTGIDDTDTSVILETGGAAELPSTTPFVIRIFEAPISGDPEDVTAVEFMTVTNVSSETLTVTRGQQGTSAVAWDAGSIIESVLTAAELDEIKSAISDIHTRMGSGTSAVALTVPITAAGNYEVRGNGSITHHIDYDASGTDATWKIRANNTTDVFTVTEAGNVSIAGTLTVASTSQFNGMPTVTHSGTNSLALQRSTNTNGSLARLNLQMQSSTGTYRTYAEYSSVITDNTNAAEFGEARISVMRGGSLTSAMRIVGTGSVFHFYLQNLPTSNPGAGILWNDSNTLKVGT